jgi:hypothetical protein
VTPRREGSFPAVTGVLQKFSREVTRNFGFFGTNADQANLTDANAKQPRSACHDTLPWLISFLLDVARVSAHMKPPKETTDSVVQAAWWSSPGILYFFAAGNPPHAIKIGVAALTRDCTMREAITRRFKEIQSSNHETVELLGVIAFTEGQYPTRLAEVRERELHMQFAHLQRFKAGTRGSEWFMPGQDLLAHITEITTPPEPLDLPRFIGSPVNRDDRNI